MEALAPRDPDVQASPTKTAAVLANSEATQSPTEIATTVSTSSPEIKVQKFTMSGVAVLKAKGSEEPPEIAATVSISPTSKARSSSVSPSSTLDEKSSPATTTPIPRGVYSYALPMDGPMLKIVSEVDEESGNRVVVGFESEMAGPFSGVLKPGDGIRTVMGIQVNDPDVKTELVQSALGSRKNRSAKAYIQVVREVSEEEAARLEAVHLEARRHAGYSPPLSPEDSALETSPSNEVENSPVVQGETGTKMAAVIDFMLENAGRQHTVSPLTKSLTKSPPKNDRRCQGDKQGSRKRTLKDISNS